MTHDRALERPTGRMARTWSRRAAGVVVTLTLLVAGSTSLAEEKAGAPVAGTTPAEQEAGAAEAVDCNVSGYDVIVHNRGADPIASGASVLWSVPFARKDGNHVLTEELEPGGRVFLTGALGSDFLSAEAECEASLGTQPVQPQ
jgi:hypothetical protein